MRFKICVHMRTRHSVTVSHVAARWVVLAGLLAAAASAQAFKIDPWSYDASPLSPQGVERQVEAFVNNPRQILLGPVSWASQVPAAMGQLKEPVHENLTDLSIRCANAPSRVENGLIVECAGRAQLLRSAADLPLADQLLIRASRWSDAPPMRPGSFINPSRLVCGEVRVPENAACWALLMSANGAAAASELRAATLTDTDTSGEPPVNTHEADVARTRRALANVLRRSHYGDMQFLHAMASPGEPPQRTRERMLHWAAFTWQVAVGAIRTDALISSLDAPVRDDLLRGLGDRTVHQFFETRASVAPEVIRKIALGALLHMVQDSFSASHTARQVSAGGTPAPLGAITAFHDYACQSPEKHAEADRAEASPWLAAITRPARDPVTLGAQLIAWARAGVAWESPVRGYVEAVVFPLAESAPQVARTSPEKAGRCGGV